MPKLPISAPVTPRVDRRLRPGTALWDQAINYLKAGYSPEQIAGKLALVNSETPTLQLSHETIYTAIYAMPRGEDRRGQIRFQAHIEGMADAQTQHPVCG